MGRGISLLTASTNLSNSLIIISISPQPAPSWALQLDLRPILERGRLSCKFIGQLQFFVYTTPLPPLFPVAVPTLGPAVKRLQRTNAISARVEWDLIPQQNRNGELVSYHLDYSRAVNGTCVASVDDQFMTLASASDSVGLLSNLDPLKEYCVRVAGATAYGVGVFGRLWKIPCRLIEL